MYDCKCELLNNRCQNHVEEDSVTSTCPHIFASNAHFSTVNILANPVMQSLLLLFLVQWCCTPTRATTMLAFHSRIGRTARRDGSSSSDTMRRFMALTPIGPFCPFHSLTAVQQATPLVRLTSPVPLPPPPVLGPISTPTLTTLSDWSLAALSQELPSSESNFAGMAIAPFDALAEFTRLRFEIQHGLYPNSPTQLVSVADRVEEVARLWERSRRSLSTSNDFQAREYAILNQLHLEERGDDRTTTLDTMASLMRWQADCLREMAKATGGSAFQETDWSVPPSVVDVFKLVQQMQGGFTTTSESTSSTACLLVALTKAAEHITVPPFGVDDAAFQSPMVAQEYAMLCVDHMNLIELGSGYNAFLPSSKLSFLDRIASIGERWDIFFARFKLLGVLNPDYIQQSNACLASLGLTVTEFRRLLRQSHETMRIEAMKQQVFENL
jgi:Domain of unknown function (DUF1825)